MSISKLFNKIRQNHWLMMAVCCLLPIILLIAAVYFFGLSKTYLILFVILLCPIMHYIMMKDTPKQSSNKSKDKCH